MFPNSDPTHRISILFMNTESAKSKRMLKFVSSMITDLVILSDCHYFLKRIFRQIYFSIEPGDYELSFNCPIKNKYVKFVMQNIEQICKNMQESEPEVEVMITSRDLYSGYVVTRKI